MWSRIGVKAKLRTLPAVTYYPMAQRHEASIALLSWGVPTFDALYTLQSLARTKTTGADGSYNLGRYSNQRMDYIVDRVKTETDLPVRNRLLTEGLQLHNDDVVHIPLHNQMLAWAMKKNVELVQRPDNRIDWRLITVNYPPESLRAFPLLSNRCAIWEGGRPQRGGAALARGP